MKTLLIEPTDVLFLRDAVPISAGQGKGAGCRLPFPSTLHEAFRASLLAQNGDTVSVKNLVGRPRNATRSGPWKTDGGQGVSIASKTFQSLRTVGPFPWRERDGNSPDEPHGLLLPVPLDVARAEEGGSLHPFRLLVAEPGSFSAASGTFTSACIPVAVTPAEKRTLQGWWTADQFTDYLAGKTEFSFDPLPTLELWREEHRVGVEIDTASQAAARGQLFAGVYLRPHPRTRFVTQVNLQRPVNGEADALEHLQFLLLGGDRRLARLWPVANDAFKLPALSAPPMIDGPCLLKWVLLSPAIFAHGTLPGWCRDTTGSRPDGRICLQGIPEGGKAHLVGHCVGKMLAVSGWDVVEGRPKPTQLAVPAGSAYHFLCDTAATARALAAALHGRARSDSYGEKGCGLGVCSFAVQMHRTSPDVRALAGLVFKS